LVEIEAIAMFRSEPDVADSESEPL
jgi:hypothetical protein